jgi:heme-degrading monooxygenase HmoA
MITHLVIWRLKETALGNSKAANALLLREKLEAMRGQVPGLNRLEVGLDVSATENSGDVVLITEFDSREELAAYQAHPVHQAVVEFIRSVVSERRLVDYETD